MKKVVAASVLFAMVGTASIACSTEQYSAISNDISDVTRELVAQDASNLGKVMAVMQEAAVAEYHAASTETGCSRPLAILDALVVLSEAPDAEDSALLVNDQT